MKEACPTSKARRLSIAAKAGRQVRGHLKQIHELKIWPCFWSQMVHLSSWCIWEWNLQDHQKETMHIVLFTRSLSSVENLTASTWIFYSLRLKIASASCQALQRNPWKIMSICLGMSFIRLIQLLFYTLKSSDFESVIGMSLILWDGCWE